jgi:hypothetical protein
MEKKPINRIAYVLRVYLLSAILLLSLSVIAQEQQTSEEPTLHPKVGIKGGVNLSNLYVADVSTESMKVGFVGGLFGKFPVTRGFSIQPEFLYSVKGARENYNNFVEGGGEYRFNLGYLELPLLAVVNLSRNFNIHAGGYGAYLINANVKDVNSNGTITGATELNANDFHRWDYGLVGGIGFDIENFSLGARYNYGLATIGKSGQLSGLLTPSSKNAGFTIFMGFGF